MVARGALFVSKRLQMAAAAFVCLMLAQAVMLVTAPRDGPVVGAVRVSIQP
jgi:hypothetical protein